MFDGLLPLNCYCRFKSASPSSIVIIGFGELGVVGLVAVLVSFRFLRHTQTFHDFDQIIFVCTS